MAKKKDINYVSVGTGLASLGFYGMALLGESTKAQNRLWWSSGLGLASYVSSFFEITATPKTRARAKAQFKKFKRNGNK